MGAQQSSSWHQSTTKYNPDTLTWCGPAVPSLYNPQISLGEVIVAQLARHPQHIGQISHEDGFEMRNWEILRDTIRVSLNLRDLGLKEGDVLALPAGNSRHVASVIFAALLNGIPISPVEPNGSVDDIAHVYGITQPKIVLCDDYNYEVVKTTFQRLNNPAAIYVFDKVIGDDEDKSSKEWRSVMELLKEHPEEKNYETPIISNGEILPAFIMCSSGTTGPPKAIPLSHAAFAYMGQAIMSSQIGCRTFCMSSLYWMTGVAVLLRSTMLDCTRIIVRNVFSPQLLLDILKNRKINMLLCTPAHIQLLLQEEYDEEDLSSLKWILCAGSAVPTGLSEKIKRPIISGYGLTEAGGVANGGTVLTGGSNVGNLAMGVTAKIIDDYGKKLGPGERGEICVIPKFQFRGYYRNETATKDMLRDGWLHTGDIGMFDENGCLHLLDRKKEIFKYNNFHINPADIENVIMKLDGVNLVSVVAIPDEIYSSLPAAVITRVPGSQLTEQDVHQYVKDNLTGFKWLRGGVYFVKKMPLSATGKIIRRLTTQIAIDEFAKNPDIGFKY